VKRVEATAGRRFFENCLKKKNNQKISKKEKETNKYHIR